MEKLPKDALNSILEEQKEKTKLICICQYETDPLCCFEIDPLLII